MRRIPFVLFALVLSLGLNARADDWSKTFPVTGLPDLRISTADGNVQVQPWDQNSVEIRINTQNLKIGPDGLQITAQQDGNRISLEAREHSGFSIHISFRQRTDITIHVPIKTNLTVSTGDGRIRVAGVTGDLDLHSGDGSQDVDSVGGSLRAKAGDGSIHVRGRFDQLDIQTGDGRIDATILPGSRVTSSWTLHTGDGRLSLDLPRDLAATLDLHTSDGSISLDVPIAVTGQVGGKSIRGNLNGGGGLMTVHTGDGSIRVGRSLATL
ncbi:MAG TPA: DUF4097 family beta strand repeat-containing protein [Verrucomicrobiae bacterium]|nr:DUF4097 family beta strand repeat-containing protein [Verrucomicrobiae bacterium]